MRLISVPRALTAPVAAPVPLPAGIEFAHALADVEQVRADVLAGRFDQLPSIDSALGHIDAGVALLSSVATFDGARAQARAAVDLLLGARYHVDNLDRGTTDVVLEQRLAVESLAEARGELREIAATFNAFAYSAGMAATAAL